MGKEGFIGSFKHIFGIHRVTLLYLMGFFLSFMFSLFFRFLWRLFNCIAFDLGFGSFGNVSGLILEAVVMGRSGWEFVFFLCLK